MLLHRGGQHEARRTVIGVYADTLAEAVQQVVIEINAHHAHSAA
jgi:hypothetical protein